MWQQAAISAVAKVASAPDGPMLSGNSGAFDARSSFDGSGWTVSTGRASATGARDSRTAPQPLGDAMGMTQAGSSPLLMLAVLGAVAAYLIAK